MSKPTPAQLNRLRQIADGGQLRTRHPRFGPYWGLIGVSYLTARSLEDAGMIEWRDWRDEQGRSDPVVAQGWEPMQVAHITEAGRAALAAKKGQPT